MSVKMKNKEVTAVHPFQRLQQELAQIIADTPAGDRLPSEPFLARQLGVSRATLREAMRAFEGKGQIRRRQGVGTFVVGESKVMETGLEVLESIETLANRIHLDVSMGKMDLSLFDADEELAEKFKVSEGTEVLKVTRVILVGERPVAYLIDTLPTSHLSEEEIKAGFTGSVLDMLLSRGTNAPMMSKTEIQAVAAPAEIAKAMQIQRSDVLLFFDSYMTDDEENLAVLSQSYFLPGYFNFHVVRRVEAFRKTTPNLK